VSNKKKIIESQRNGIEKREFGVENEKKGVNGF
jgi:hypothetical protein